MQAPAIAAAAAASAGAAKVVYDKVHARPVKLPLIRHPAQKTVEKAAVVKSKM